MNIPAMETRISMVGSLQPVTLLKVEPIKSVFQGNSYENSCFGGTSGWKPSASNFTKSRVHQECVSEKFAQFWELPFVRTRKIE